MSRTLEEHAAIRQQEWLDQRDATMTHQTDPRALVEQQVQEIMALVLDHETLANMSATKLLDNRNTIKLKVRAALTAATEYLKQPQGEALGQTCADGGKCHHNCDTRCFRREWCEPLSGYTGPWAYDATHPQATEPAPSTSALPEFCTCDDCKPMECEGCRTNRERREAPSTAGEAEIRVIEKATCFVVQSGNQVLGSFAGPQAKLHAAIFSGALKAVCAQYTQPAQGEREAFEAWWSTTGKFNSPRKENFYAAWQARAAAILQSAPSQRALTDEQIAELLIAHIEANGGYHQFARAIERAHGIGGQQ